ncbi:hypothetical protein BS50DRAFT_400707 [Corynespora cassiicola Philippines]|uniref:Uncharacterized protein n=1 Tax=Corynespora cassiicola Philippines TaxID=1448308 RepID=A0A2T2NKC9_CORCC|nr:hypothetical protein BS50DRAFT_400707 [Corynespora cassiicola Philippines]
MRLCVRPMPWPNETPSGWIQDSVTRSLCRQPWAIPLGPVSLLEPQGNPNRVLRCPSARMLTFALFLCLLSAVSVASAGQRPGSQRICGACSSPTPSSIIRHANPNAGARFKHCNRIHASSHDLCRCWTTFPFFGRRSVRSNRETWDWPLAYIYT